MDKLLKWAETIIWYSYPEHKPINDTRYLTHSTYEGGCIDIEFYHDIYDAWIDEGKPINNFWSENADENVIAFADLPTGSIGDEFGFDTALLLMQEGEHCKALSDNPRFEYHFINEDGKLCVKDMDCIFIDEMLPLSVILGKWRLT